ncbi:hypothetical protein pipiens_012212 [Culex pipiens pipiens]|uniref:Uncharacterized protein n=1 Tax=Culex pipiens pipiens TaxID=38569 RepID=A0ABD1D3A2_CULPP
MKSGRLTIAWYRNRPSPTTPGWLRSWARNISTMLGYKSDGRVEVVVIWCTKHWPSVAILRVANGLDYSEILGEDEKLQRIDAIIKEKGLAKDDEFDCNQKLQFVGTEPAEGFAATN